MANLTSITQVFVDALSQVASAAMNTLNQDTASAHTFYQTCMSLVGNVSGNWTTVYENKFTLNNGRSELIQAKIYDFYSASHSLGPDIESLCSQYDNLSPLVGSGIDDGMGQVNLERFLPAGALEGVLIPELDAFASEVILDYVLDSAGVGTSISSALTGKQNEIISNITSTYDQYMQDHKKDKQFQKDLTWSHESACQAVRALTTRLQKHLNEWADKLYLLVKGYQSAVEEASNIDKIDLSDIAYEIKLNPTAPVLIWQLPNGHLIIAVTGAQKSTADTVMQWIRIYLQNHGLAGKRPSVTLLGFDGGVGIAQQIIGVAYPQLGPQLGLKPFGNDSTAAGPPFADHTGDLPFKITNALFAGQGLNLPPNGTLGSGGIPYQAVSIDPEAPSEAGKRPWWNLTTEQWTTLGILGVLQVIPGVGEAGDGLAAGEVANAVLGLSKDKILEYAVAVGWNVTHKEGGEIDTEAARDFLIQKLEAGIPVASGPISSPSGG